MKMKVPIHVVVLSIHVVILTLPRHLRPFTSALKILYLGTQDTLPRHSAYFTSALHICLPYRTDKLPAGLKAYQLTGQDDMGNVVFEEVGRLLYPIAE